MCNMAAHRCYRPPMTTPRALSDERLLSVGQVATLLAISTRTVRRYIADGDLPAARLRGDGPYRIRTADAQALLLDERPAGSGGV
jgi:excisionase family DNA binding protein